MSETPQLLTRLNSDLKRAMKGEVSVAPTTVRQLLAAVQNKIIAVKPNALTDADVLAVFKTELKKRREAATAFAGAGRDEAKQQEEVEAAYIETFLPAAMPDVEIQAAIDEVIASQPSPNIGAVMGAVMKKTNGQADGTHVRALVEASLKKQP